MSTPILADILLSEFSDDDVWLVVVGFKERFNGASPELSEYRPLREGIESPEGLPFVAGNLITSTLSEALGERLTSCDVSYT